MESSERRRFGNYEILGLLGRGGMAEVFRARVLEGPRAGQLVALKRLAPGLSADAEAVDQFTSEADLSRFLDHPNIVRVYESGVVDDVYFMVMELIDGRDVAQVLKRCRSRAIPWPVDFAVYVARALLDALSHAHLAKGPTGKVLGIVHCDVSPSNVFVSRTGDLKLGDFGVARARSVGGSRAEVLGKPFYLSPEVLDGKITPLADLWAVTVTLYELLTLDRPFTGSQPDEVFAAIRGRLFTPLSVLRPEVPEALAALVERNFSLEPSERIQTAAEYAAALEPLYDERVGTPLAISAMVRGMFGGGAEEGPV